VRDDDTGSRWNDALIRLLLRVARGGGWLLGGVVIVTLWLGFVASQNSFDYDLRDLMGDNPHAYEQYEECVALFGHDDDILVAFPMNGISTESLRVSCAARQVILEFPGILRCLDLAGAMQIETPEDLEWLLQRPRRLQRGLAELRQRRFLRGMLVSPDEKAQILLVQTKDLRAVDKQALVRTLRRRLEEVFGRDGFHLLGYPVFTERYVTMMGRENAFYLGMSLGMAFLMALVLFGSFRQSLMVTLTVALPGVWTQGCYALLGYRISLFSALLMPVVMLVGLSLAIQFLSRFERLVRQTGNETQRLEALSQTLRHTLKPSLLCAVTTVIGFASQTWSSVRGIRAFGLTASLGCGFSWAGVFLLLPALLLVFGKRKAESAVSETTVSPKRNSTVSFWGARGLVRLTFLPPWCMGFLTVAMVVLALGVTRLETGSDPLSALPEHDPVVKAHRFYEKHFGGGTRCVSLVTRISGERFDQLPALLQLREVVARLASDADVLTVVSPTGLLSALEMELSSTEGDVPEIARMARPFSGLSSTEGDVPEIARMARPFSGLSAGARDFPRSDADVERLWKLANGLVPGMLERLLNVPYYDRAHLTVALRVSDSVRVAAAAQRLEHLIMEAGGGAVTASATGRMLLSALVENQAIALQANSFGGALWVIVLLVGCGFGSVRAFGVALLANGLPILLSLGVMGWLKIPVDSATAMAPCVCVGIIVDDTIHLIHEMLVEERRGCSPGRARALVVLRLGKPVVAASGILLAGLGMLCLSEFGPIRRFGGLAVCTVIVGLLWELVLTPALLALTSPVVGRGHENVRM
jgi:hypothetical protein